MKRIGILVLALALSDSFPHTCAHWLVSDEEEFRTTIKSLKSSLGENYRVDPYIRAAQVLQKMGKDEACRVLGTYAAQRNSRVPIGDLCRLLFKARKDSSFRRQLIGSVGFLGGTDYNDWPLDPFEIIDGVPFVVTNGSFSLHGFPESDKKYLEYCITECDWNDLKFVPKSEKEYKLALNKLLALKKWKRPLTSGERNCLQTQIK